MAVLDQILAASEAHMHQRMFRWTLTDMKSMAAMAPRAMSLRAALEAERFSLIGEVKHRSPSTGMMSTANVIRARHLYPTMSSVAAISVVTDRDYFGGGIIELTMVRRLTDKPVLLKDFVRHEFQVYEARALGADAVLLIAGILEAGLARDLYGLARQLGMDVLFEIGEGEKPLDKQARVVPADASIWGVNARRFRRVPGMGLLGRLTGLDPWTDKRRHEDLLGYVPAGKLVVAESGVRRPEDLARLMRLGYRAALVGTAFLRRGADVEAVLGAFDAEVAGLRVDGP